MERVLESTYYGLEDPASYGSIDRLAKRTGTSKKKTREWLKGQDTYTLHRPVKRKFDRRRVYAKHVNDIVQLDLADMQSLAKYNDGYRFILLLIDVFGKKGYGRAIKSKSSKSVVPALNSVLDQLYPPANFCQSDRGVEWLNRDVQAVFRERNIKHYWTMNDEIKAAVVERWIRTLKSKIYKYFTHKNTYRWIDVLQTLIENYNNTYHRSIKMTPNQASETNTDVVRANLYPARETDPVWKYRVGEKCRISKGKHVFHKGYREGWSEEIFVIHRRFSSDPVTYGLKDLMGEEITGRFYEDEIQPVTKEDGEEYIIERVLKTRRNKSGKIEYLVKWRGYDNKFNSWVDEITNI
jgi:hypothetical protein